MGVIERIAGRRTYLDANVFIYAVEEVAPYARAVAPLFDALRTGDVRAVTSELSLAEALVAPFRDGDLDRQRAFARTLQTHGGLSVVPVTRVVLLEAARLRAAFPALKLPDAVHVASARLHGCEALLTNDARLREAPGLDVVLLAEAIGG